LRAFSAASNRFKRKAVSRGFIDRFPDALATGGCSGAMRS
jgi:hypothetical protein